MKICFMLGGFTQNGGIGRVTSILINKMCEEYPELEILTLSYYNNHKPNIYLINDKICQKYFLEDYCDMTTLMLKGGIKKLKNFLKEENIDVLIACGALFYPIAVNATKKTRTKCICWEHTDPERNSDHKGQQLCRKYGIKKSDLNVVLTKSALEIYKNQYHANNTIQIYNPIDQLVFDNADQYRQNSKKIISVGRLTYQKNFENAIEIAKEIFSIKKDWIWDIYGDGELKDKLEQMIIDNNLESHVFLKGQVTNIYNVYNEYSFMVMTSRYEGFPMSLLEGLGNGLPLLSYDIKTGPNEIIEDGKNGYLIDNLDKNKMINSIIKLIENPKIRMEMSLASKKKSLEFEEKEIVEQWFNLLTQI